MELYFSSFDSFIENIWFDRSCLKTNKSGNCRWIPPARPPLNPPQHVYLLSLRNVFFKRRSAFPWVSTVLLCLPTCSFIRMKHINFIQGLLNEKIKVGRSSNCLFRYIDGVVSLKIWWLCWSYLPHWIRDKWCGITTGKR
jgi:hypothetical protein